MSTSLASAGPSLFGQTRAALLALFFSQVDRSFYIRQLVREIGGGHGALQRELKQLTELGLLVRRAQGNQVLYQANSHSPVFPEMKSLIAKTVGIHDALRSALAPLGTEIQIAFVYGSVARQAERADSDVDLMVLGNVLFSDLVTAVDPVQKTLAREVNPTVFSVFEFRSKLRAGNHFLRNVMRDKKLFLVGTEDDLAKLATK